MYSKLVVNQKPCVRLELLAVVSKTRTVFARVLNII